MVVYEFYCPDDKGEDHLIGILPERRKSQDRITTDSIMGWVRKMPGNKKGTKNVFFIEVEV